MITGPARTASSRVTGLSAPCRARGSDLPGDRFHTVVQRDRDRTSVASTPRWTLPPKVEYSLTEHGVSLDAALESLGAWGTERVRRIGAGKITP